MFPFLLARAQGETPGEVVGLILLTIVLFYVGFSIVNAVERKMEQRKYGDTCRRAPLATDGHPPSEPIAQTPTIDSSRTEASPPRKNTRKRPTASRPRHRRNQRSSRASPVDWTTTKGFLKSLGYSVSQQDALRADRRRRILRQAFELAAPPGEVQRWGHAASGKRLLRIAKSLKSFAELHAGNNRTPEKTWKKWIEDLNWLQDEIYDQKGFRFEWPVL